MAKNALVDTGFWYALYDPRDQYHKQAQELLEHLEYFSLLIPWPSLYETLNTRFIRNPKWLCSFENYLLKKDIYKIPDESYREQALENIFVRKNLGKKLSLVDMVIRAMLDDSNIKIDSMITFNRKDFEDICRRRRIEIVDY